VSNSLALEVFRDREVAALADYAAEGNAERVRELALRGVDFDAVGLTGLTPLLWALAKQSEAGVEVLLELGADPNRRTPEGLTPLTFAAGMENPRYLQVMLAAGADPERANAGEEPILHSCILKGRWVNVATLLDHGVNIETRNGIGMTPVLLCAFLDDYEGAYFFIERGADVRATAEDGSTLAYKVQTSNINPASPAGEWLRRVRHTLIAAGIRFPVPPPATVRKARDLGM
jgi:ankyrin repeat protein